MYVAKRVHKGLETTRIPKKLRKELGRKRINRVFRDQEELPVGSDLGANIEAALLVSDYLIVICSPQTKESAWVMKEIDTFIEMHGREHILAVLVEGEPGESFPPQLLMDENGNPVEPLAADVRGATKKEVNKKLKTETMRLAAAILGVDYDDLKRRQRERVVKRNMGIAVGVAALGLAIGAFSAYNLARINQEYQQKLVNESKIIAAKSGEILETGDRKAATLIAMEGMPEDGDRPLVPESMYALSKALGVYNLTEVTSFETHLNTDYNVKSISSNTDSDYAAILDANGNVYVWNVPEDEMLYEIQAEYDGGAVKKVLEICFAEGDSAVAIVYDNMIRGYDLSGKMIYEYQPEDRIVSATVSWGQKTIAIECLKDEEDLYPDSIAVINPANGEERGVFENDSEAPYSYDVAIDWSGDIIAVGHMPMEGVETYVSEYNLYGGDEYNRTIPVINDTIVSLGFVYADEWHMGLAVSSVDNDSYLNDEKFTADIQYYDFEEDRQTWTNQLVYYQFTDGKGQYQIEPVSDGTSEYFQQSIISAGRAMYIIDNSTGEIIDHGNYDDDVNKIISAGSLFFTLNDSGSMRLYIYDWGLEKPRHEKKLANNMSIIGLVDNHILLAGDEISYVQVLSFSNQRYYKKDIEFDEEIYAGNCSPDGKYYYITTNNSDSNSEEVIIYSSDDHEEVGRFEIGDGYRSQSDFLDNDTIMFRMPDQKYYFYSIKDGTTEVFEYQADSNLLSATFTNDFKYAVEFSYTFADVYDICSREKLYHYNFDYEINICNVSHDGKTLYVLDKEGVLHFIDPASKKEEILDVDYEVTYDDVSPDGKYIAVSCDDNKLRLIDIETKGEYAVFNFAANTDGFMLFSNDGKYLYTQASNRIFRIYDIENNKLAFVSDEISDAIYRINYDDASGFLSVMTDSGMYLIDMNEMGVLAYVQNGMCYLPGKNQVISTGGNEIFVFDYMDAEELKKEVHKRYGDAHLSDEQKLLYGISF